MINASVTGRGCVVMGLISLLFACAAPQIQRDKAAPLAHFDWYEYRGQDAVFSLPLRPGHYRNPVVAGFYPDPSVVRVGADYYMVHSSFAYAPGIPILHSTDLVNWRPLGHVLTRDSHLMFPEAQVSRGIFAPTIRYHDGTFYVITTAVDVGGNFIVTAEDPEGPWSDPIFLPQIDGIDPDFFFDDGRVYILHNGPPPGGEPLYEGHRAIYLWEYDPQEQQVIEGSQRLLVNGGADLAKEPVWIEAPHLYKIDGWYYLLCAEGGTAEEHSEVVFRARRLEDEFRPWSENPILTQRDLDPARLQPIATAGHADLVQTQNGQWWAVFLATRNYDQHYYNTGRETYLLPVDWIDGWPRILPADEPIPYQVPEPEGLPATPDAPPMTGNFTRRDDFSQTQLGPLWSWLRVSDPDWLYLAKRRGHVSLQPLDASLAHAGSVAFLAQRQQHLTFDMSAALQMPLAEGTSAGVAAFQNEQYHYYLGVRKQDAGYQLFLEKAAGGQPVTVESADLGKVQGPLALGIRGKTDTLDFYWRTSAGEGVLASGLDAKILSTQVAGGFVGTMLGLHARSE